MAMEIKLLLVDSNHQIRRNLLNLLSMYQVFRLEAELETTVQAVQYIQAHEIDVVFINEQPADPRITSSGTYLAAILAQSHPHVQVVVYSDARDDAYGAFRSQCAGFLLFPFDPLSLQALTNRLTYIYDLQQAKRESVQRSIMIKTRSGYQLTRLNDILFVERSNRKNRLITADGQETLLQGYTMNEIEQMLDGSGFYRCYQSFIVNLSKISFIRTDRHAKNYAIQFQGYEGEILLSRDKYGEVISLLRDRYAKIHI